MHVDGGLDGLRETFSSIDIYLFDQLLKGRVAADARVLDAGCGRGRNVAYLLRCGLDVRAVDRDPRAVAATRALAASLGARGPGGRCQVADVAALPFADASFDLVISSAVLHFSRDEAYFRAAVDEAARVLRAGGILFARLASTVGIEGAVEPMEGRWHRLPDGTDRFLVDEALLLETTERIGGALLEPLKTTVVHGMRAMTTWVVERRR